MSHLDICNIASPVNIWWACTVSHVSFRHMKYRESCRHMPAHRVVSKYDKVMSMTKPWLIETWLWNMRHTFVIWDMTATHDCNTWLQHALQHTTLSYETYLCYMGHDSVSGILRVLLRSFAWLPHSYVCHDWFVWVTWPFMCVCVTRLDHMCDMTHSYMWLSCICDVDDSYVCHDVCMHHHHCDGKMWWDPVR